MRTCTPRPRARTFARQPVKTRACYCVRLVARTGGSVHTAGSVDRQAPQAVVLEAVGAAAAANQRQSRGERKGGTGVEDGFGINFGI